MRHIPRVFILLCLLVPVKLLAAPIYLSPTNGYPSGEHPNEWLAKRTSQTQIQKWLRLKLDSKTYAWTSEDTVLTRANLIGRAFVTAETGLYLEARTRSEYLRTITASQFVTVLGDSGDFLKVRTADGETGYTPHVNCVTARGLTAHEAIIIRDGTVMRSAPTPDSAEIKRSSKLSKFQVIETASLKWGRVEVEGKGSVWWPLDGEATVTSKTDRPKFSSSEIFLQRKVFDLASSPTVKNLRFASANGIFRTLDDKQWEKIPKFGDQNYPIAISKTGRLFVGFWYSDDHGETFHSFVRFDQLIGSLKNRWQISPHRFKFIEVRPVNASGSELIVKVDIGLKKPVEAVTHDQGSTWTAL